MFTVTRPCDTGKSDRAAFAWRDRAEELAGWAWARLVNRTEAWGGYRPPGEWGKEFRRPDGRPGKLGQTTTRKGELTRQTLAGHFRGRDRAALVGLHSTSPANTSRWGFLDIDWHGPDSTAPEVNQGAALHWHGELARRGFRPVLLDSNGRGGFHLGFVLREPAPTPAVHHFLGLLTAAHAEAGLRAPPERFPKQASLGGGLRLGNWLRLPGRHHTRQHWSRLWSGAEWLEGHEAVEWLLAVEGDDPALLPAPRPEEAPRIATPPPRAATRACFPPGASYPCRPRVGSGPGDLSARITRYLARLPNLAEGQGRDDVAYHFAAWLVRDLALDDQAALIWLERWDGANNPPKGRERLTEILAGAHKYGRHPYGSGLDRRATARRRARTLVVTIPWGAGS
jgi:hypothetical protein